MLYRPRFLCSALVMASLLSVTGCQPKAIRGGEGTENPDFDEGAMSTGLDRKDLQKLMDDNMAALVASPLWANWRSAPETPVVAIWPFLNDTSEHIDDQLHTLLSDMETELVNSGVVAVVSRERQAEMMSEANIQQGAAFNPALAAQLGQQIGAQYFLTGKVQALDERTKKERRVQYSLFMQVIEVDSSLVKFQNSSDTTKGMVR